MNRRHLSSLAALLPVLAALPALPARADEAKKAEAPDPGGKYVLSGLLDGYYQYNFNHSVAGTNLPGRSFDVKADQFALSLAELNVKRTTGADNPFGFTATLTAGKTADLVHATEPGTKTVRFIQQLYGTYVSPTGRPITIDAGKFVTHAGYEVIESSANDNYSRGLLFNYAIPFYHMGIRASTPLSSTLTGMVMLVNGWNNVEDDNGGKSIGAQLAWTPTPKWTWYLNYLGGNEFTGAGLGADLNVQLFDLVGVWNLSDKLKLAGNFDYASASRAGGGNWNGYALYARYKLSAANAAVLRWEHFEDSAGLRTGTAQNLSEITATLEHAIGANGLLRLEYRHDHAGSKFFPTRNTMSNNQDTLTFGHVLRF